MDCGAEGYREIGHQGVYMDCGAEGYREMGHRHPWVNVQKGIVRWDIGTHELTCRGVS